MINDPERPSLKIKCVVHGWADSRLGCNQSHLLGRRSRLKGMYYPQTDTLARAITQDKRQILVSHCGRILNSPISTGIFCESNGKVIYLHTINSWQLFA